MIDAVQQFQEAAADRGLVIKNFIGDGRLHRCDVGERRNGRGDGAYIFFGDNIPAGGFENHQDGIGWETWKANIGRTLTPEEDRAVRAKIEEQEARRRAEEDQRRETAKAEAAAIWSKGLPADHTHPYLRKKGIAIVGIKQHSGPQTIAGMGCSGALIVPMRTTDGELRSLQFINENGEKRFLPGGQKKGCYFAMGLFGGIFCVAEGLATAATIHAATGLPVAVAFDANNLKPVAIALRQEHPQARFLIAADDDASSVGNPGLAKAKEAALAVSGDVVSPWAENHGARHGTDFNDLATVDGLDAVRARFATFMPQTDQDDEQLRYVSLDSLPLEQQLTDAGNAARFIERSRNRLRWVHESKGWLLCDERTNLWREDVDGERIRLAVATAREGFERAASSEDSKLAAKVASHAAKSQSQRAISAMIDLGRAQPGVTVMASSLDRDEWLLGTPNGVIDLKTGTLRSASPDDLMTKSVNVEFDPKATCPTFERFVSESMKERPEMISFLQRLIGYSLIGANPEQKMVLLIGVGANGKSTLLRTVLDTLGTYAMTTPSETFLAKRDGAGSNDIARLRGARIVSATEAESGRRLAEALIKRLTGNDPITARFLFSEYFEFVPQFLAFLAVNHRPIVSGDDPAIWRRLIVVPFDHIVPPESRDHHLLDKLARERAGILAWAVRGCLAWQKEGLQIPEACTVAADLYRGEMDTLGLWLEERCELLDGVSAQAKYLYQDYVDWTKTNGHMALSNMRFGMSLGDRGLEKSKTMSGMVYRRIRLLPVA